MQQLIAGSILKCTFLRSLSLKALLLIHHMSWTIHACSFYFVPFIAHRYLQRYTQFVAASQLWMLSFTLYFYSQSFQLSIVAHLATVINDAFLIAL